MFQRFQVIPGSLSGFLKIIALFVALLMASIFCKSTFGICYFLNMKASNASHEKVICFLSVSNMNFSIGIRGFGIIIDSEPHWRLQCSTVAQMYKTVNYILRALQHRCNSNVKMLSLLGVWKGSPWMEVLARDLPVFPSNVMWWNMSRQRRERFSCR